VPFIFLLLVVMLSLIHTSIRPYIYEVFLLPLE
jgi:hypothetical protein